MGQIEDITNESKQKIRRLLLNQAKERIKTDVGDGYGLALLSLYIEAHACRGDDATCVTSTLQPMLDDAIRASDKTDDIFTGCQRPGSSVG
jgi:hypothetical protein